MDEKLRRERERSRRFSDKSSCIFSDKRYVYAKWQRDAHTTNDVRTAGDITVLGERIIVKEVQSTTCCQWTPQRMMH
jgi:hypothetical protein